MNFSYKRLKGLMNTGDQHLGTCI